MTVEPGVLLVGGAPGPAAAVDMEVDAVRALRCDDAQRDEPGGTLDRVVAGPRG